MVLLVALVLAVVLRGPIYRAVVHYKILGIRDKSDLMLPPVSSGTIVPGIYNLIDAVLDTTAQRLHFSAGKVSNDPAMLGKDSAANCIGYAALFKAILQKELASTGQADAYDVEQVIGQLNIGDRNLHKAFSSPFWKDHDIVRIRDKRTGSSIYVDPTLYDAVGIGFVSGP